MKKFLMLFLVILIVVSIFPFDFALGYLGAAGSPVQMTNASAGGGELEGVMQNSFIEGYDGLLYCLIGYGHKTNGYPTYWKIMYSTDNGTTWGNSTGSTIIQLNLLTTKFRWGTYDWIYDRDNDVFHITWFYTYDYDVTEYKRVYYQQGVPLGNGTITLGSAQEVDNMDGDEQLNGIVNIDLYDSKPVITLMHYNGSDSSFEFVAYWGDAADPSSWDVWVEDTGYGNYVIYDIHRVSATDFLMVYHLCGADGKIRGQYFDANGFDGNGFDISTNYCEGTTFDDSSNGYITAGFSTVSHYTLRPDLYYATDIMISYIEKDTFKLRALLWNAVTRSITEDVEVDEPDGNSAYHPYCAKDEGSYFVGYGDRNDTNNINFCLFERDASGDYGSENEIFSLSFNEPVLYYSQIRFSKSIYNSTFLYYGYTESADRYSLAVDGYGEAIVYNNAVEISDMENPTQNTSTYGSWCFAEWKFYSFAASYGHQYATDNASEYINSCWLYLTDGVNSMTVEYDVADDAFSIFNGSDAIALSNGSITQSGELLNVTFKIMFLDLCVDVLHLDVYMYVDDIYGNFDGWDVMQENYFNLYVHGGFNDILLIQGDGGRLPYGGLLDLYATNDTWIYCEAYYRNLQHAKIDHTLYIRGIGWQDFDLVYGLDIMLDDGWQELGEIRIEAESVTVGSVVNINFTVYWYDYASDIQYHFNQTQVYMFHHNGAGSTGDPTETEFWVDLWFDTQNESTTAGFRINAFEYPMEDNADPWMRWFSTNWGADQTLDKDATLMLPIRKDDDSVIYANEIKMMRLEYQQIVYSGSDNQYIYTRATHGFAPNISPLDRVFEAMETPPLDETQLPAFRNGGWLGSVLHGFTVLANWLSDSIGAGLLSALDVLIDAVDSFFTVAGWENGFSQILNWIATFLSWTIDALTWFIELAAATFDVLGEGMGKGVNTIANVFGVWADMLGYFFGILDGTYTSGVSLWNDLDMGTWVIIAAILYPMYLLILWDEKGFDVMLNHIRMMVDIFGALLHFLITVAQFAINLVFKVIDAIPIIE